MKKAAFAIVGCGKVGTVLGYYLGQKGFRVVGTASRSLASARQAAELMGCSRYSERPWEVTRDAELILITTPDGVIADVCEQLAAKDGIPSGSIVLHCSGALPSTILTAASACGALTGSMHPLQSFAAISVVTNPFKGIVMDIEGEPDAVACAIIMAEALESRALEIKTAAKTLYHAAAVVASNYLVALMDLALKLMQEAGLDEKQAYSVLKPLVQGTFKNIERLGLNTALTGPVARGDLETVGCHLEALQPHSEELQLYRSLGLRTVQIAASQKRLPAETLQQLRGMFE